MFYTENKRIYKLLVLVKDFIHLFNKYIFSVKVVLVGIPGKAMSNTVTLLSLWDQSLI